MPGEGRESDQVLRISSVGSMRPRQQEIQGTAVVRKRPWPSSRHWRRSAQSYANDPPIQFCLNAARRSLGDVETARNWYAQFAARPEGRGAMPPWPSCGCSTAAARRPSRSSSAGRPTRVRSSTASWTTSAGRGSSRWSCGADPRDRDGDPKKPTWTDDYRTEVYLTYDRDYLYLGLVCRQPKDRFVAPVQPRPRDADVRPFDRVSLLLDVDRDYSTAYHLQIDQRGCTCEDCWGDLSWNPKWFVAVKSEPGLWQIEAAIPLAELTSDPVSLGKTWACNVVRVVPGQGVQAFSLPADVQPRPEGMGLLTFVPDRRQAAAPTPPAMRRE